MLAACEPRPCLAAHSVAWRNSLASLVKRSTKPTPPPLGARFLREG